MSFSGRRISILRPGDGRPLGDVSEGDDVKGASTTKKELSPNGNIFPCLMTLFETLFIPPPRNLSDCPPPVLLAPHFDHDMHLELHPTLGQLDN
jgi:hypothetical protein